MLLFVTNGKQKGRFDMLPTYTCGNITFEIMEDDELSMEVKQQTSNIFMYVLFVSTYS